MCFFFLLGFKLKDFLQDNETLSHFLHHNASLPRHALKQIVEADVNLEKVEHHDFFLLCATGLHQYQLLLLPPYKSREQYIISLHVFSHFHI